MLELSDLIIRSSDNLKSALQQMTRNRRGVLFVCDEDAHLVGVLSDGDVRRSLLEDTLMVSPVEQIMNTDPITAATADEAAVLLRRFAIVAVPVLDAEGRICEAAVENQNEVLRVRAPEHSHVENALNSATDVVAIIPARGGSKRIPKKNLAMLAGRSLLGWSIQAAKDAVRVSRVLVSTDDAEIAEAARKSGVEVPWMRPPYLSQDDTPTLAVLEHALEWAVLNVNPAPEFGVLLEPTAPLRRGRHIDRAVELLAASDADCVMSVSEVPHVLNPEELLTIADGVVQPYLPYRTLETRHLRGLQSSVYVQNGLVYAFRIGSVLARRSLYGQKTIPLITPWEEFLDIDTPEDLSMAAVRLERALP